MEFGKYREIKYHVLDPTGNITALVETAVDIVDQPAVASRIMELEPDVEQAGFVTFADEAADVPVSLRMAGGEFCGNATMCAAALYMIRRNMPGSAAVKVSVSGAAEPLEVMLERRGAYDFASAVTMPPAIGIDELRLSDGMMKGSDPLRLPIVRMEGIAHVIIEPDSGFFGLKDDPALAETLLRGWCGAIGAECLGMMFLGEGIAKSAWDPANSEESEKSAVLRPMTPLVYVPGADTMFWENSCASGSAAAGIYLAAKAGKPVDVTFDEPAGRLRVESDPPTGKTILHGSVVLCIN